MNTLLQQARQRAQSRATAINSLHEAYKKKEKHQGNAAGSGNNKTGNRPNPTQDNVPSSSSGKSQQNDSGIKSSSEKAAPNQSKAPQNVDMSSSNQLKACVEILMNNIFEVKNDKNREFVRENFAGKAVILENTFSQRKAGSAAARIKRFDINFQFHLRSTINFVHRKLQGQGKLSKRELKRRKLINHYYHPSKEELLILLHGWQDYVLKLMQHCQSIHQLQARYSSSKSPFPKYSNYYDSFCFGGLGCYKEKY
jgi:hypothetical protein